MRIKLSKSERIIRQVVQHYNARKYWKYREIVLNFQGGGGNTFSVLQVASLIYKAM